MISALEMVAAIEQLEADPLQRWIDQGWVLPQADGDSARLDAVDVARVRLICDLHYELRIEESSLSVVLSLLDQLDDARREMRRLTEAVEAQPQDVRDGIARSLLSAGRHVIHEKDAVRICGSFVRLD